jgi:excisionase family DNA binding protein
MRKLADFFPDPKDLTLEGAAKKARVHTSTIRRWIDEGLPAYRWGKGGRIMVRENDLARFLKEHRQL